MGINKTQKIRYSTNSKICLLKGKKHGMKRRNAALSVFSPFPTMFPKAFFSRVINVQDCVVNGEAAFGLFKLDITVFRCINNYSF